MIEIVDELDAEHEVESTVTQGEAFPCVVEITQKGKYTDTITATFTDQYKALHFAQHALEACENTRVVIALANFESNKEE